MPGRRSKYDPDIHPALAQHHSREGLNEREIAKALGVALSTFNRWKVDHEAFREGLRLGRIPFEAEMTNRMVSIARTDGHRKQYDAIKFILERRFHQKWKERKDETINVDIDEEDIEKFETRLFGV